MKEEIHNLHPNKEQILKLFVNNLDEINMKNDVGWTPLYRTIVADDCLATEILLEMGADPNVKSNIGETPLFQAVEMGLHQAIKILLNYKADPNLPSNDGRIPLHNAVSKKELNIINLLLQFNSNPNAKNKLYSQSPLHLAMKNSVNISIVDLLIKHGGDLNLKDKYDKTPMDYIQLEETKTYILNLLNSNNTKINQLENEDETLNGFVNENKKDSIRNKATNNCISSNNNICEKNESIARFLTPSKDELFEKEFFQNTESKTKFESDLSIIEKANMSKLNNYNLENKIININNSTNKDNNLNLNNINSNFFSGMKNNLNLTDFLTETDKNYKLDLSTEAKRQLFPENNIFDFSGKKNRKSSCDPNEEYNKDNLNLNKKQNKNRGENKKNEIDKYTIDIRDSNKFSLSDFQIKEMMQNANNNKNEKFHNEINLINTQNKQDSLADLKKDLNQKEKSPNKNNVFFNLNDYSTFENKNIDFDKIDLTNNYNIQNTHEDAVVRLSQNTNNIDINLYNTNNTNNFGEKPKTPKSVFSPMTFFKNNNTNSKSDSNSKYLLSERDKNAHYEKDQFNLEGNSNNFNNTNNLKLKQINSLKPYNSNSNFHNTLGSNTNSHNLIFSDRKFLNNDNEYILEDDETSNLNILKNNLKNINILDSEGKEDNDIKKKNSKNNNKYENNNNDHNIRNNQINKNLNKINFENFTLNTKTELEAKKGNNSPSNYESDSFEEKPNKKLNKKCSQKGLKCHDKIKELKGSEFSCDEKLHNITYDNFTVKNNNFANSNRSSYNKFQNPSENNLRNKSENSILNNQLKESNERFRKELMEQDNENENVESELISYINAENVNNNFYYNEKDLINGNIIKTGNYDSFISRDHSRNSFLFLTNRQSADNNRSYCKSINNNEGTDRIINVHKSNNSEKKNAPESSHHNLEGLKNEINESNNKSKSFYRLQKESKSNNSNSNLPNIPKSRKNSLLDTEKLKFKKAAKIKNNNILPEEPKVSNHNYNDSTSFDFTEREKIIQKLLSPRDENNNNNANNNNNSENDFENNFNENEISIIKKKMENFDHNVKKDSIKSNQINKIHLSNKKFYEDSNMTNNINNLNSNKKNSNNTAKEPKLFSASVVSPSNIDINYKVTENSYCNSLRDINNILNTESANNTLKKENTRNEISLKSPNHLIFAESEKKLDLRYQNNIIDVTRIKDFKESSKKININLNQSNRFTDLNINFSTKNVNGRGDNLNKNFSPNENNMKTKINFFNTEENISCLLPEEETSENENFKNNINNFNENTNENYSSSSNFKTNNNYSRNNINTNAQQNFKSRKDNFPQLNIKTNNNFFSPIAAHNNSNFTNTTNHNIFNFNANNINELRNSRKNCISEDNKKIHSSSNLNLNKMAGKHFSMWKNSLNGKNINTKSLVLNNISPKNFSYGNLNNLSTNKNSNSNSKIYGGAVSNKNCNLKSQNNSNLGIDTLTNSYILSNKARDNYFNFFSTENKDAFKNSLYTDNTNYVNNFINTNSNNIFNSEFNSRINSTKNIDLKKSQIRSNNNKSNKIYNNQKNNQFISNCENIENMENTEYINDYINADFEEKNINHNNNFNPVNCISKNQALLIHNWLFSMNLAQYYNNFIENGLINLESIITRYLESELNINNNFNIIENYQGDGIDQMFYMSYKKLEYEDLEKIGIRKPGHIYKILTRIEYDAKLINQNLSFLVKSQINPIFPNFENNLDVTKSMSSLRVSDAKVVCCSLKQNKLNANKLKNEFDFHKFLDKYKLKKYERNFSFNGFDSLEYIFLQFFSSFKFDEEILENKLHIYEQSDRIKILVCLMKELKEINIKLGLNINLTALFDDEMNNIYEEENLNIFDNRKEEEGCKACLIF